MIVTSNRKSFAGGLALSAMLAGALAGCGGGGPEVGDAVLTPGPEAVTSTAGSPATAPAAPTSPGPATPEATTPAASTSPAPAAGAAGGWGTLKGRVVFTSSAPEPKVLVAEGDTSVKDPNVCAKEPILAQKLVVDPETKGVKFAIVFLPKPTAVKEEARQAAAGAEVEFDQEGCVFKPHVLATMAGTTIKLKSSDPVGHNVNSKVTNNAMNSQIAPGQAMDFPAAEPSRGRPGRVTCDIHPWMEAWWLVLDNPYFAVTDEQGNFEIKDVPSGTQKVAVWQEAAGFVTPSAGEDVAIAADGETTKEFALDAGKVKLD